MFLLLIVLLSATVLASGVSTSGEVTTTFQHFLALPSLPSLSPLDASLGGFANQHITVIEFSLHQTLSAAPTDVLFVPPAGTLKVGYNDHFYTHILSLDSSLGHGTGETHMSCTGSPTSDAVWTCNSKIVNFESANILSYTPVTTTLHSGTIRTADHIYPITVEGLLTAPSQAAPATATTTYGV